MEGSTVSDGDLRDLYPSPILDTLTLTLSSHYRIHPSLSVGRMALYISPQMPVAAGEKDPALPRMPPSYRKKVFDCQLEYGSCYFMKKQAASAKEAEDVTLQSRIANQYNENNPASTEYRQTSIIKNPGFLLSTYFYLSSCVIF